MSSKFETNDIINFTVYDGLGNIVMQRNSFEGDVNNMEQFNLEKHWDGFIEGQYAVNCKTKELAEEFLNYCHKSNLKWRTNSELINNTEWKTYKEKTTYHHNYCGMEFASSSFYKKENKYIVIEFNGFDTNTYKHVQQPKPPLGVMPKDIYELVRVQELCRALYERSTFEEVDYNLMIKWSDELSDRLYGLKDDKLYKKAENADDCLWNNL
jgi:hypothetical protein